MEFISRAELPASMPPRVWCDFNACGWSGGSDDCYYVLDSSDLVAANACEGLCVLLYDWEDDPQTEVLARVAELEPWNGRWRARPLGGFYSGAKPW